MKKIIFSALMLVTASVAAKPNFLGMKQAYEDCNTATEICAFIKGDNSLREHVSATVIAKVIADGQSHQDTWETEIGTDTYESISANVNELKAHQVSFMSYGITQVNGQAIADCVFSFSGNSIQPGMHTLMLSKSASGYSCQKI